MAMTSVLKILEAVRNPFTLTRSLGEIQLWREEDGSAFYRVGNSVVLFKIRYDGEWRAMRCYMRSVPHLAEIYGEKYLAEELFVWSGAKSGQWVDVVLEEWKEGVTLHERVERAIAEDDRETLTLISDRFDLMASEMLHQEWAHGDLTAENILVTPELQLRLIDFDCKFLPQLKGELSPELGTEAYQPPTRRVEDFDGDIDDYSIALISTALRALSIEPTLYHKYKFYDGLLFDPALVARNRCEALCEVIELFARRNMALPFRVAHLLKRGALRIAPLRDILCAVERSDDSNLELFMKHGYVGYATADNKVAIPPIYDDGLSFGGGVARVRVAQRWIVIDGQNRVVEQEKLRPHNR